MPVRPLVGLSAGSGALPTTAAVIELGADTSADVGAEPWPRRCKLGLLLLELSSLSAPATTITVYLAADPAGDVPITDRVTIPIVPGHTTPASAGGAVGDFGGQPYRQISSGREGKVYLVAALNSGTGHVTARATWEVANG